MASWQRVFVFTVGISFYGLVEAPAQSTHPVSGRQIAPVMGVGGADWLVRPEREREEQPELALDRIGLKPGMHVGDVGAGVGYFSMRMARRVGPEGKVYANDIQPGMIQRLRDNLKQAGLANVIPVPGTETDPKLPAGQLDLVLMVDVYHELAHPREMLAAIAGALKPGGRLVLLEYRKEDPEVPIREEHKMSIPMVRQELEAEGFLFDKVLPDLPRQHILIFRKARIN
ncbi:MAG: methyltransferase domain-containing protein [Acidobacteriia bacterium]|nr:methyltransferase domain-containing protein [Terriglobia bacterium]